MVQMQRLEGEEGEEDTTGVHVGDGAITHGRATGAPIENECESTPTGAAEAAAEAEDAEALPSLFGSKSCEFFKDEEIVLLRPKPRVSKATRQPCDHMETTALQSDPLQCSPDHCAAV